MNKHLLTTLFFVFYVLTTKAQENKNIFIFGHSLINHDPPLIATPSNETSVPHWLHFLAQAANNTVAVSGQYGFLTQHDNLPPTAQWGFEYVTPAWDMDSETFSEANFDLSLITPANFIQYQPCTDGYYQEPNTTPLSATLTIVDWLDYQNQPDTPVYIYENWPDMVSYLSNGFPATESEFQTYNYDTQNSFNDWWINYHDLLVAQRPNEVIKMIPVGPIISKLLSQAPYNQIPITELYEDDAPHGRPSIYFLAAMITYAATYQTPCPTTFTVPNTVNTTIANNYSAINTFIWNELLAFNFTSGESRVFTNNSLSTDDISLTENSITIYPNPVKERVNLKTKNGVSITSAKIYDLKGNKLIDINNSVEYINTEALSSGIYLLSIQTNQGNISKKIIKN